MRSGHTEAAVDLCKLASLPPIGVICELVNDDGTVMRGPQVADIRREQRPEAGFGRRPHRLPPAQGDADRARRQLRHRDALRQGPGHTYSLPWDPMQHLAVVFGDIRDGDDIPVRLHPENVVGGCLRHGLPARRDHEADGRTGRGVIVYLREGSVGVAPSERATAGTRRRGPRRGAGAAKANGWKSALARRS